MSKFDEVIADCQAGMAKNNISGISDELLVGVAKALGPSIYNADSSLVSCSDSEELDRVKNNFLIGKLGLSDDASLDAALTSVCEAMGSSNRQKHRPVFYALLVKHFGKESMYA